MAKPRVVAEVLPEADPPLAENAAVVQGKFTHFIWGDLPGIGWGRTLA